MKRCIAAILTLLLCLCPAGLASAEREEMSASARTTLEGSSYAKLNNIELAASSLNGITVPQGATFSFNDIVGPRTAAYGYQRAANGRGARVTGGGVAQCATTLYLALQQLDADVEYLSRKTYGSKFTDNYVSSGSDAIMWTTPPDRTSLSSITTTTCASKCGPRRIISTAPSRWSPS